MFLFVPFQGALALNSESDPMLDSESGYFDENGLMTEEGVDYYESGGGVFSDSPSVEEASAYAEKKGFDIIVFLQKAAQPFLIVCFILCAIMTIVGWFGHGGMVSQGLFGMGICAVIFAIILSAPEIIDFFQNWLRE